MKDYLITAYVRIEDINELEVTFRARNGSRIELHCFKHQRLEGGEHIRRAREKSPRKVKTAEELR